MTSTQIHYFLAVAKHLNFSEAARGLYVSQPSLSRSVSALEEELGVQLFIRTKKYVRLSPAGTVWLDEFRKMHDSFMKASERAQMAESGENASIRIGMLEAQESESFLPKALRYLKKNYPGILIELIHGNFKDLRDELKNNTIDIAITLEFDLNEYTNQDIVYEKFFRSNGECAISRHHPLANEERICLEDLKDETMIIISPEISRGGYDTLLHFCAEQGFTPKRIQTASSIEHIMLLIESGLGFSILDENCKLHHNPSVRFVRLKNDDILNLAAVWHKDNLNPAIPLFINHLIQNKALR